MGLEERKEGQDQEASQCFLQLTAGVSVFSVILARSRDTTKLLSAKAFSVNVDDKTLSVDEFGGKKRRSRSRGESMLSSAHCWRFCFQCDKIKKRNKAFFGSLRMAHSNSLDEIDQRILDAR